jgi:PAS domain S-box-containing protein
MRQKKNDRIADTQLYEAGFTHSRDIILFVRREDAAILKANAAAMSAYGYTEQEMLALTIYDLRSPETGDQVAAQLAKADAEGVLFESVHRRKDGSTFPVEISSRGVTIDSDRVLISVVRDITERKLSEQALGRSSERLRMALLGSPVVVWEQDRELRFTWIHNPPAGWELDAIHGKTDRELLPPQISAVSEEIKRRVIRTGEPARREIEVPKEGRFSWWDFYVEPVRNAHGQVTGIRCAATDLTERKMAEEALRSAKDELEMRVKERTAELERRNQELQEFAFVASHDLSEPLRKIESFGSLLVSRSAERLDEHEKDYLLRMTGAAQRMKDLLDGLLRYSRIQTRAQEFEPVDLDQVVLEAISDLELTIARAGARVETGPLPQVTGDRDQLCQLFQNLIANALKFCRPGVEPLVRIYARKDEASHLVVVEDNGIGFDEKYLDKIFQPFQRLHGRGEYEGIGMGLAICKRIVERHRGTITAESKPGTGSAFIVSLPKNS